MGDKLASMCSRMSESCEEYDIIQSSLQHLQQVFPCDSSFPFGSLKIQAELSFRHAVISFEFLLLSELNAIAQNSSPGSSMFTRRVGPALDRTFFRQALITLQKKFFSLCPALTTDRFSIS
jgi:hypothetical protein